ncbi:hypothetical protein [Sulfitobacter donghicola]|uniref:TnsA endonuclease N-terminal domain-containing protein n=1 Tax=Sulfitobacter donghicola DSW-25 = KCTC 12864 = JCM 14565 TaxID=1300350 RepID=A0A073IHL5_9RHOB|nr:hypothetical protein [Sulfitobacter donghicola]KEJ89010.1 hypothetical protein DSW25_12290 [Sulfitobacter donghicola DSW-25 = KCTC 12864 = JCM 14565]KIN67430.1 hypothetical protein Z948_1144 [Sulfitobacter donghicola DSW-25 = KCTC 12864 = JCM 14565]
MSYPFHPGGFRLPEASSGNRSTQVGSSYHFTGQIIVGDGPGRCLGTESHLEMKGALILSTRPETAAIFDQIVFEWYDDDGVYHKHFIDLVVQQCDGKWVGYAVRPTKYATAEYIAKLARIKAQAMLQGFLSDFRLFTEEDVDPTELFNAKLLHSVRVTDPDADEIAKRVVSTCSGVTAIGTLVAETGLDGMGFRAIVRLIRSGHLKLVQHERITHATELFKAQEV